MFDLGDLRAAVALRGRVARVVIAAHDGSSPREAGAAMLVWADGQSGTIGGGALEYEAAARARTLLARGGGAPVFARVPLGPALGQCCGGAVTLATAIYDSKALAALEGVGVVATGTGAMPLAVRRLLAEARGQGRALPTRLVEGWLVEPVAVPARHLWIWGAGHVGRALAGVLSPLPDFALTWVDTARDRFPEVIPQGVTPVWAAAPEVLAGHAPPDAEHLVLTYSHALDLELCHRLLARGFSGLGLIGSATKWARFRSRLIALGHAPGTVDRILCPIGDRALGKHPQAIALGVAAQLLRSKRKSETEIEDGKNGEGSGRYGRTA